MRIGTMIGAAVALLVAIAVPAPAQTAGSASAALVWGAEHHPGAGRRSDVRVSNGENALGRTIDTVRVTLPASTAGVTPSATPAAAAGWSVAVSVESHSITFSRGAIGPGGAAVLPLALDVARPQRADVFGVIRVAVSYDGGATFEEAVTTAPAALKLLVRVLELDVASAAVVAPAGATDGTATAGQELTYALSVRNHAVEALDVYASLSASDQRDRTSGQIVTTVAGGAATWARFQFAVWLGATTGDRTTVLVPHVSADNSQVSNAPQTLLRVQSAVRISAGGVSPQQARSGTPITVAVTLVKTGTPAATISDATLWVGGTAYRWASPIFFAGGTESVVLRFADVVLPASQAPLPVAIVLGGSDGNDAVIAETANAGAITVDDTPPVARITDVALPLGPDGEPQPAVKSGDGITVRCDVGADAVTHTVRLEPDVGAPASFTGACGKTISGTFPRDAGELYLTLTATDAAGNTATDRFGPVAIDQSPPKLAGKARVTSTTTIVLPFTDPSGVRGGCDVSSWTVDGVPLSVAEVRTSDGRPCGEAEAGSRAPALGTRVLVLRLPLSAGATPTVIYRPCALNRLGQRCAGDLGDRTGNDAPEMSIETVWGPSI